MDVTSEVTPCPPVIRTAETVGGPPPQPSWTEGGNTERDRAVAPSAHQFLLFPQQGALGAATNCCQHKEEKLCLTGGRPTWSKTQLEDPLP